MMDFLMFMAGGATCAVVLYALEHFMPGKQPGEAFGDKVVSYISAKIDTHAQQASEQAAKEIATARQTAINSVATAGSTISRMVAGSPAAAVPIGAGLYRAPDASVSTVKVSNGGGGGVGGSVPKFARVTVVMDGQTTQFTGTITQVIEQMRKV